MYILEWLDHPWLLLLLLVLNIPVYRFLMELFFEDVEGLKESIRYWFTPDILSAFRGEIWDDRWAELKLAGYIGANMLVIAAEYAGISKLLALTL